MNLRRLSAFSALFLIVLSFAVIIPASADLEPDFDWEVYRIDTDDWAGHTDYVKYDGTIYEVHFTDMTSGAVSSWKWEFGDEWWPDEEENPVHVFTEEVAEDDGYTIKVKLTVTDSSGIPYEAIKTVFLDPDDPWNLKTIYDLTPEPTATPTPVPTAPPTQAPTPAPTQTEEPAPAASHTFEIPGLSKEMTKLQDSYAGYIDLIKAVLEKAGIKTGESD